MGTLRADFVPGCRCEKEMGTPEPGFVPGCRGGNEVGTLRAGFVPRCRVKSEMGTPGPGFVPGCRGEGGLGAGVCVAEALPAARAEAGILCRRRRTRSQTRLQGLQRAENVAGAFRLRHPERIGQSRHILIVDDVFTTGATLSACHRALRTVCGRGVRISVATLACVR